MDAPIVDLSRLTFGFSVIIHFLFVPLTIGMMPLIALMEWRAWRGNNAQWRAAADFWGRLFVMLFIAGVATGYPLRYEIAHLWTNFAVAAESVATAVFDFEGSIAPLLFGQVLVFAFRGRLPAPLRTLLSVTLSITLIVQSAAILALNAWMQLPVGVTWEAGRAHLSDLSALFDSPLVLPKILHTIAGAYVAGGMMIVAGSAWMLLRRNGNESSLPTVKLGAWYVLAALTLGGISGHWSGMTLAKHQPMKFAAIEALWETHGEDAPFALFAMPDQAAGSNAWAIEIPGLLGFIAEASPEEPVHGINDLLADANRRMREQIANNDGAVFDHPSPANGLARMAMPAEGQSGVDIQAATARLVPPVGPVFWAFRVMLFIWVIVTVVMLAVLRWGPGTDNRRGRNLLRATVGIGLLPSIAIEAGWIVCEMGRQPWTITGVLATHHSTSALPASVGAAALLAAGFILTAGLAVVLHLIARALHRGLNPQPGMAKPQGEALPQGAVA